MDDAMPAEAVSGDSLMRDVAAFARWQKLSGTPAELDSFRYLEGRMGEIGYRTTLLSHDAYISLPGAARVDVDNATLAAITHSFSRASPQGGLAARVLDLGDGSDAAFADQDARGAIVLVDGIASPAVADRAARAGAVGQLHVSPHQHLHEMCISPVWGSPSARTRDALPRTVACTISDDDGAALRARLARGEAPRVVLHAAVDTGWRRTPLLVAELDAPDAPADGPFVLFSGHHDTWYFGVMDNGSANATMIEAARVCAGTRARWKRGLRLCFWSGHSHGRYSGSAWYVDAHFDELARRCMAHVNVDSTGGIGATVLENVAAGAELRALAAEAVAAVTGVAISGRRMSRSSDMSFWGVGIPSMFGALSEQPPGPAKMRNALGWWWHTAHDTIDKIDPDFLARDTAVFVHALTRLLTSDVLPLDYATHADALLAELATLGDAPGLDAVRVAATELRARATALAASPAPARDVDAALMRVSRALVPVEYTEGDRFRHDPALPQSPWPALDPLRALAGATPASEAAAFLRVDARRACNRVLAALRDANAALASVGA